MEPTRVTCFGEAYLQHDIFDVTVTSMEFRNQIKAHIFVSWLHPFKEQRLVVVGSKQMVVFDDTEPEEKLVMFPHTIEWHNGRVPVAKKAERVVVPIETGEPLRLECAHFLDCIEQRRAPFTNGEEGVRVLRVIKAAEESLRIEHSSTPVNFNPLR